MNGTLDPFLRITTAAVRFRILNAGNARMYRLGFTDSRRFHVVGTDAGLLPEPVSADRVALSPGERVDIVAEFIAGESVILRSFSGRQEIDEGTFELLQFKAATTLKRSRPLPARLAKEPLIKPREDDRIRTLTPADDRTINGKQSDPSGIDVVVPAGAREIWEIDNQGPARTFHIQQATLRMLEVNAKAPQAYLRGPKDTVFVPSESRLRLAVRFGEVTDPERPYRYHCHILGREGSAIVGQFLLVKRGTEAKVSRAHDLPEPDGN